MSEQLPPNIDDYLENNSDNISVNPNTNEELIYKVIASTGLEKEVVKIIIKTFFQELRNQILKGNTIVVKNFGKFLICSPRTGTKKKVFIKFKPFKNLLRKLNDRIK
jgi:nucleoid DNA-binding protein